MLLFYDCNNSASGFPSKFFRGGMTIMISRTLLAFIFFFNDTATTEIYTLSLHDALPISCAGPPRRAVRFLQPRVSLLSARPGRGHHPTPPPPIATKTIPAWGTWTRRRSTPG